MVYRLITLFLLLVLGACTPGKPLGGPMCPVPGGCVGSGIAVSKLTSPSSGGVQMLKGAPDASPYWADAGGSTYTAGVGIKIDGSVISSTGGSTLTELIPTQLNPYNVATLTPLTQAGVGFQPPALVTLTEPFTDTSTGRFTQIGAQNNTVVLNGSTLTLTNNTTSGGDHGFVETAITPGMPQAAVAAEIVAVGYTHAPSYAQYSVILAADSNNSIRATWDAATSQAFFMVQVAGAVNNNLASVGASWTPPFYLGLSVVANTACLWYRTPSTATWTLKTTVNMSGYRDYRANGSSFGATFRPGVFAASQGQTPATAAYVTFDNLTSGSFGASALRDPEIVTAPDGTPYAVGNAVYFTATASDGAGTAYMGLYTYDVVTQALAQVGVIMSNRYTATGTAPSPSITLTGNVGVTGSSATVSTTNDQRAVVYPGAVLSFTATLGVEYVVQSVTSSVITLTTPYQGGTNGSTTARLGVYQNDNAGHLIRVGDGSYHLWTSTWGNTTTTAATIWIDYKHEVVNNLMAGAWALSGLSAVVLPDAPIGTIGSYDPFAMRVGSTWYLAYTHWPAAGGLSFYPALASSTDLSSWSTVGTDSTAVPYEGSRLVNLGGSTWAMWGNITAGARVYDTAMNFRGVYTSLTVGSGTYAPHPMVFPLGPFDYQLTFDDTVPTGAVGPGQFHALMAPRYVVGL